MVSLLVNFRSALKSAMEKLVRQNLVDRVEARKLLIWMRETRLIFRFWECV